ncbi:hypothetical protein DPMN_022111 [Dreissena polymorpha]|uniref:Uncharacterized protein n=1 Tax=Dreissena polymorpha TaxID=45954 RepID=A0A9D4SBJ5_DREPO|nr:hypothetical protein DPMN_022111 [Dreissena polymorpha]
MVRYSGDRTSLYTRTLKASTEHRTGQGREYIQSGERTHVIQSYNGEILRGPYSTVYLYSSGQYMVQDWTRERIHTVRGENSCHTIIKW